MKGLRLQLTEITIKYNLLNYQKIQRPARTCEILIDKKYSWA
jgi:hypothetical protein